jgi:hypothetical protein
VTHWGYDSSVGMWLAQWECCVRVMGCGGSVFWDVVAQCFGMWWLSVLGCDGSVFWEVVTQCGDVVKSTG